MAEEDTDNIFSYIENISSTLAAKKVVGKIVKRAMKLNYMPKRVEPFGKNLNGDFLYSTISGSYRIIYLIDENNSEVEILRILHKNQNRESELD